MRYAARMDPAILGVQSRATLSGATNLLPGVIAGMWPAETDNSGAREVNYLQRNVTPVLQKCFAFRFSPEHGQRAAHGAVMLHVCAE